MGRYLILTRLGVDLSCQGLGLGKALVGVRALLIHCENDAARDFYLHPAKFDASPTDPLHLFLLIKDLRKALDST